MSCKMSRAGSGPEFRVNSGSGRVGSLHLWVGLGRVKKTGPTSDSTLAESQQQVDLTPAVNFSIVRVQLSSDS